jgi:hypothetical protein
MEKYRVKTATIALVYEGSRQVPRTVPAGAIVTLDFLDGTKLVEVIWEDQKAMMFAQDLRTRGEKID